MCACQCVCMSVYMSVCMHVGMRACSHCSAVHMAHNMGSSGKSRENPDHCCVAVLVSVSWGTTQMNTFEDIRHTTAKFSVNQSRWGLQSIDLLQQGGATVPLREVGRGWGLHQVFPVEPTTGHIHHIGVLEMGEIRQL